jgi:hydrogenase assembly chaperone HypC/HupF
MSLHSEIFPAEDPTYGGSISICTSAIGVRRLIGVHLLADDNLKVGDWVLVYVGFAMAKIDEHVAALTLARYRKWARTISRRSKLSTSPKSLEELDNEIR